MLVKLRVQACFSNLIWVEHLVHEVRVLKTRTSFILLAVPGRDLGIVMRTTITKDYTSLAMGRYCSACIMSILEALLNRVLHVVCLVTAKPHVPTV